MVSFPYYSHTTPIRIPKDMGMVWEAYHKGVPLLGSLESPLKGWGRVLEFFAERSVESAFQKDHLGSKYGWSFYDFWVWWRKNHRTEKSHQMTKETPPKKIGEWQAPVSVLWPSWSDGSISLSQKNQRPYPLEDPFICEGLVRLFRDMLPRSAGHNIRCAFLLAVFPGPCFRSKNFFHKSLLQKKLELSKMFPLSPKHEQKTFNQRVI